MIQYRIKQSSKGYHIQKKNLFWQNCEYTTWGFAVVYYKTNKEAINRLDEYEKEI
jgi:hypothetical protein